MNSAVFFDRDGIINKYVSPTPKNVNEIVINKSIIETITSLKYLGYDIFIVSNQPDVERGFIKQKDLNDISLFLLRTLDINGVYNCIFSSDDHPLRKPNPGMLIKASQQYNLDLSKSWMIGDSFKDIEAGRRAGCKTIFLLTEYNTAQEINADFIITDLNQIYPTIFNDNYQVNYFKIASQIANQFAYDKSIDRLIAELRFQKQYKGSRLFILGVGGSAGNSSHAVCDFRKLAGIEAYSVTDNVSELTARINDNGWKTCYKDYLVSSNFSHYDAILVFSVGGGSKERHLSENIIEAVDYAKDKLGRVFGIIGKQTSYVEKIAHCCVSLPIDDGLTTTPMAESMQSLIWHMLVTHPKLKETNTVW